MTKLFSTCSRAIKFSSLIFGLLRPIYVSSFDDCRYAAKDEVSRMKKLKFFFVIILCAMFGVLSTTWDRGGSGSEAAYSRESGFSVVNVYGPDKLTELAGQAIQEKRPDIAIVKYYKPLKNKVWIEGTTGAEYMLLSPERVDLMQAAKAKGKSVYSALCSEQNGVIDKTVGTKPVVPRVERDEYRTEKYHIRPICPLPPVIWIPPADVGCGVAGYYPLYGFGRYGKWGDGRYSYYRGRGGYRYLHTAPGDGQSGSFRGGGR